MKKEMKKKISLGLIFALMLSIFSISTENASAAETEKISFSVEYKQTEARNMVEMINSFRASDGLYPESQTPLAYDYDLEKVAMQRAAEIAILFDDSHNRPDGTDYTQALAEYGFNISPRGAMYGENILFGTDDTMTIDNAFAQLKSDAGTADIMLGYYKYVGIGHIKIEEKTDFWVQVFSNKGRNGEYVAPLDGKKKVTVNISTSCVSNVEVSYVSGDSTVPVGSTVQVPSYIPKIKLIGSELSKELELSPLVFESSDEYVSASNGTMTGLKEGTGTIRANLLGRSFSYNVTVTKGSGINPTPTVTSAPTTIPTSTPTEAPTPSPTEKPTPLPTEKPTPSPTEKPTPSPTATPTAVPTAMITSSPETPSALKKGDVFSDKGIKYVVLSKNKVSVSGVDSKKIVSVTIPSSVKKSGTTYKVTKIAASAFKGCTKLKSVEIGKNVTSIGNKAFYGCSSLENVIISGTSLKSVGAKSFSKTNPDVTISVPKASLDKYKKLLIAAGLNSKAAVKKK